MAVKTAVSSKTSKSYYALYLLGRVLKMLGNLKNPPEPFAEIIRTHFRLKSRSISAQLDQWLAQDDGVATSSGDGAGPLKAVSGSSNGFAKDVEDMKQAMQELQQGGS